MIKDDIAKVYEPQSFERKWYEFWEKNNFFHAEIKDDKKAFCIVMPPPNVTGKLHMGHALDNTLQDILIRWRRMQGYSTLWMPGVDHAGIATQAKVEEKLREDGKNRYMLGREKFIERVFQWKEEYGSRIMYQLRMLGVSCDWEKDHFTMDKDCSLAVREVFVRLYEKGLIYQGRRITNYCPSCNTALSDIEVDHEQEQAKLWHLRYPLADGTGFIEIATTRPETMFGDTGIGVHPDDARYKDLIGKHAILPIVNRLIPIFADSYVDPAFGTGAVKVTPAHDPNDFEMGLRHDLPQVRVIENDATLSKTIERYGGLDRYECRKRLVKDLEKLGVLVSTKDHEHAVGHCSRCKTTVEPLISKQWFIKMKDLAKPAIKAVEDGSIRFLPERFTKIYINWLKDIRDWCISRQLWWGHRIPAWHCKDCKQTIVSKEDVKICPKCKSKRVEQDEDVLDTWFSSALWPFATLGFPKDTKELKTFYPTSVLVTGSDIIFFWVARMVMMGLEFMKDVPFGYVFIHGLVRDSKGRKMSKSLGNGVDPVAIIEKYGADTLRFMLITGSTPGNDTRFYLERVEASRNFANKLWNASRFILLNLTDFKQEFTPQAADYTLADRWILSRFQKTVKDVTENLEKFELGEAGRMIYDFIWSEFCDWYIELTKARLYEKAADGTRSKKTAQYVLYHILNCTLRLLHPFMPFVTEEIWQRLAHEGKSIMLAPWVKVKEAFIDEDAEQKMSFIMEVIVRIRNMRAEVGALPGKKSEVIIHLTDAALLPVFTEQKAYFALLSFAEPLTILPKDAKKPENAIAAMVAGVEIYLPLKGLIDIKKEKERLEKEYEKLAFEQKRLESKLENAGFINNAPPAVVAKEREKLAAAGEKKLAVKERLAFLAKL